MLLGIEIGGTKLQLGLGKGDGKIVDLWRGTVNPDAGGEGIRQQIVAAFPELLASAKVDRSQLRGIGVGFGGPTDDETQTVIQSHQIEGWNGFPLAAWLLEMFSVPAAICNDADVAGLAEATIGAGKGLSPVFYITVGSGIGGGLIINGVIYRGQGKGAAEIGHLKVKKHLSEPTSPLVTIEDLASGWGIANATEWLHRSREDLSAFRQHTPTGPFTAPTVAAAARAGDWNAQMILHHAIDALSQAICHVIALLCPKRIVIGGGVSMMGDDLFFDPLRRYVAENVFAPFAGLTDIVPAALGEEVVLHGALALARQKFDV